MCVAVYATVVMLLWCALSLSVFPTIIVTDIYVHSLVELQIIKNTFLVVCDVMQFGR